MSNKPMGMAELINRVGDDNLTFQRLGSGYFEAKEAPKECKIRFATSPGMALQIERSEIIGFVVWLKKEDVDRAIAEAKSPKEAASPQ